jgi:phosphoribosylpyrophosphate synthetase
LDEKLFNLTKNRFLNLNIVVNPRQIVDFASGKKLEKVKQLNLAPILAEAIRRLYLGEDIHIHKNGPFVSML